jgi:hypothetical protein
MTKVSVKVMYPGLYILCIVWRCQPFRDRAKGAKVSVACLDCERQARVISIHEMRYSSRFILQPGERICPSRIFNTPKNYAVIPQSTTRDQDNHL